MLAFCFHFPTLMGIICSTIVSTATRLDWLNINPNKMTEEISFQKYLRPTGHTTFGTFNWAQLWSSTTCWRGSEEGQHKSPPQQRDQTLQATEEWHQPSVTSSYLRAPASKSFFTAAHRASECQKPQNPRGTSWHRNGENIMSPGPCTQDRYQVENRSRVNKPGDFQKAHPRSAKRVLREQTILLLLWKEAELLGKCLYLCKPQKWRLITENQFHYSKWIFFLTHFCLPL